MTTYSKYRGQCKKIVDELCHKDPSLTPVRGYYICWAWGKQQHWWAVDKDGRIVDPTIDQFPKPHIGEYIPFDGYVHCDECGRRVKEEYAYINGRYAYCSYKCQMTAVGLGNYNASLES